MARRLLLHPERKRCLGCRSHFGFTVVLRAYCSQECADGAEHPLSVEDLPRQCRVWHNGGWRPKASWPSARLANRVAKKNKIYSYLCEPPVGCGRYHLTSQPRPYIEPKDKEHH